jgi:hypothetical protein
MRVVRLLALLALAGCVEGRRRPVTAPAPAVEPARGSQALANLGPDVDARVLCGDSVTVPYASVSSLDETLITWTPTISGAPEWTLDSNGSGTTVVTGGLTTVVTATLAAPLTAVPGDRYDAIVSVRADADAFPPGTVNLHGEVVAPVVTVDQISIDFGDIPLGGPATRTLTFRNESPSPVLLFAAANEGPFVFSEPSAPLKQGQQVGLTVVAAALTLGDYTTEASWRSSATVNTQLPPACLGSTKVTVHVRIVAVQGGAP